MMSIRLNASMNLVLNHETDVLGLTLTPSSCPQSSRKMDAERSPKPDAEPKTVSKSQKANYDHF
jgi:hypothetical protein